MADNVVANPGVGGANFATDDDGTAHHPYVKVEFGADNTQTKVSTSDPLPVVQTGTPGLPTGAATVAKQDTGNTSLASIDGKITAVNTGAVVVASGSITANAGTNLNTSTLALETGGNLAASAASLSVLDDWDETDRAKVNIIAAQAGVDGNSGNKSAATVRVVIATDQPALTNKLLVTPDANSAVNVAQINGVTPLMGAGNTGTGSHRVTIATDQVAVAVKTGTRSYKTASGTLTADTDVIAAVTSKRIKVYALSLTTVGTNANAAIWKSNGTSGTELWRTILQGASGSPMGERLAVSPGVDGAFLFATVAGEKLTLDVGNSDTLHYSLAYWDDDAT